MKYFKKLLNNEILLYMNTDIKFKKLLFSQSLQRMSLSVLTVTQFYSYTISQELFLFVMKLWGFHINIYKVVQIVTNAIDE